MKIQQQNSYNPNMKALYFTKVRPIVAEAVKYKDQKLTQNGIKYVEEDKPIKYAEFILF